MICRAKYFSKRERNKSRAIVVVHALSYGVSLDRNLLLHTLVRAPKTFFTRNTREHRRSSFRRDHWRPALPNRGQTGRTGSVARVYRASAGRADGVDAVLRPDAGGSGAAAQQLAGASARTCFKTRRFGLESLLPR